MNQTLETLRVGLLKRAYARVLSQWTVDLLALNRSRLASPGPRDGNGTVACPELAPVLRGGSWSGAERRPGWVAARDAA